MLDGSKDKEAEDAIEGPWHDFSIHTFWTWKQKPIFFPWLAEPKQLIDFAQFKVWLLFEDIKWFLGTNTFHVKIGV